MKRLKNLLVRWLMGSHSSVPLVAVPAVKEWTFADALAWKTFLLSPAGQALWERARARQAALCVEACSGGKTDPKTAGGFTFTIDWLESLANPEAISSEELVKSSNSETTDSDTSHLETELA